LLRYGIEVADIPTLANMALTRADLDRIAAEIFVMRPLADTRLPVPTKSVGAASLAAALDPVGTDARFTQLGIGVADFTASLAAPRIWLHNGGVAWRLGSTGKVAILLAAAQLRDDVRAIQALGLVNTPADFDTLFATKALWTKAPHAQVQDIATSSAHAPRISTIFDFSGGGPAQFIGPNVDAPDMAGIIAKLGPDEEMDWPDAARQPNGVSVSERLWLAGSLSDNVAATASMSEIGVAYIKAVQRAYGLFVDGASPMHMLLAGQYANIDSSARVGPQTQLKFRQLADVEKHKVRDALLVKATGRFEDQDSWQGGSATSLLAYLIALQQNRLVTTHGGASGGAVGCTTIRACLSKGGPNETRSIVAEGVASVTTVTLQISKIGLLGKRDGEPGPFDCELAYLETKEPASGVVKKYGVALTGLRSRAGVHAQTITQQVGAAIHTALLTA
jgi:hypothetical protein